MRLRTVFYKQGIDTNSQSLKDLNKIEVTSEYVL